MKVSLACLATVCFASQTWGASPDEPEERSLRSFFHEVDYKGGKGIEEKEVCVVGGGAAGSYTAYELQKRGYDTLLVEPLPELGGNCEIVDLEASGYVNAAVILFSQTPEVIEFFTEFGAMYTNFTSGPEGQAQFLFSTILGGLGPDVPQVIPQPSPGPAESAAIMAGLQQYLNITSKPPYLVNGKRLDESTGLPDFSSLPEETQVAFNQTWDEFLAANNVSAPQLAALSPIVSSLSQGTGYLRNTPMWIVLVQANARFVSQLFGVIGFDPFVVLIDGCQVLYNSVQQALLANDSTSLKLNTKIDWFRRLGNGKVLLKLDDKSKVRCDKMIAAFRPIEMEKVLASSFTREERYYFDNLGYNGYVTSVWKMKTGPILSTIIGDKPVSMSNLGDGTVVVNTGITSFVRDTGDESFPWRVFYQPDSPPITKDEKKALFDQIKMELEFLNFTDVENVLFKPHRYFVIPQSPEKLNTFYRFMNDTNFGPEEQSVYYTGALLAGEATEYVYRYSKQLLEYRFPDKSN